MGHFSVTFDVGNRDGSRFVPVDGMVDTGATFTQIPRSVLEALGVEPTIPSNWSWQTGLS